MWFRIQNVHVPISCCNVLLWCGNDVAFSNFKLSSLEQHQWEVSIAHVLILMFFFVLFLAFFLFSFLFFSIRSFSLLGDSKRRRKQISSQFLSFVQTWPSRTCERSRTTKCTLFLFIGCYIAGKFSAHHM